MSFKDYVDYDGVGLAQLVRNRAVHPCELVEAAIERIERNNPQLNAVVFQAYDEARARAAGALTGPFAGVPFLLKDIGGLKKGWPTRQGAGLTPEAPSTEDSTLVARYTNAGLVFLGKTNVPEFGIMAITESDLYGPAHNPWHLEHSPGGSSGGSAVAVAAGIVPMAHAGDGGGSIRIPASCCGLVGLKPTRARTPGGPQTGDVMSGMVIDHILSRTVRDSAAMLDATAGPELGDPYCAPPPPTSYLGAIAQAPRRLRIGFAVKDLYGRALDPECERAVLLAAQLCEGLGHYVEEASPTLDNRAISQALGAVWAAGHAMLIQQAAEQSRGRPPLREDMQGLVWATLQNGLKVSGIHYLEAWATLHRQSRRVAAWHQQHDVWLTPTLSSPPWQLGHFDTSSTDGKTGFRPMAIYSPFTALQNMTGQPAINVPLHWSGEGLPIGVQFAGRFGEDDVLLQLAAQLEQAQPWIQRKPPVWN